MENEHPPELNHSCAEVELLRATRVLGEVNDWKKNHHLL